MRKYLSKSALGSLENEKRPKNRAFLVCHLFCITEMALVLKIDDFDFILIFNAFKAENRILLSVSELFITNL